MLIFPTYQTMLAKAATSSGSSHVTTDLNTYYDFGNSSCYQSSSNDITDLSGNGNGATVVNHSYSSYSSDQGGHIILTYQSTLANNQKINFDVKNPLRTVGSGPFTLEFWFNPIYTTAYNSHIWAHFIGGANSENTRIIIRRQSTNPPCRKLRVSSKFLSSWTYIDSSCVYDSTDLTQGVDSYGWEHLVISRESQSTNGVKFYRDNSLIGQATSTLTYNDFNYTGTETGCMGNYTGTINSNALCPMKIGIYRLYIGTALTSTDVATNWNADKSRFGL